jgi:hypothetical protein
MGSLLLVDALFAFSDDHTVTFIDEVHGSTLCTVASRRTAHSVKSGTIVRGTGQSRRQSEIELLRPFDELLRLDSDGWPRG